MGRCQMSLPCRTGTEKSDVKNAFHYGNDYFTQGMQKESVYIYIQIFRLVIIEQFRWVTVLLVLISAVAPWRMETALSHLEIKWSGVWLVPSNCGKEKMSICRSSSAALCNELTDWIRNAHSPLSYRWYEFRTVTSQGDVVTRKVNLECKIQISKLDPVTHSYKMIFLWI